MESGKGLEFEFWVYGLGFRFENRIGALDLRLEKK
jgi:hypothetical protein